jgi:hypothetical protein
MRYFGLYFGFFCFAFNYLFKRDISAAFAFGADMLFSYFIFTTALAVSAAVVLFAAIKKGFRLVNLSPFFGGLFKGAAGVFFLNLGANRSALLLGSYMLGLSAATHDFYMSVMGLFLLALGYIVFRPFNFDFIGDFKTKQNFTEPKYTDESAIDVQIVEDFEKLEKR